MIIEDIGYIIRIRKHQEHGLLLTLLSQNNGLITGYHRRNKINLTPGQKCYFTKKFRLNEHLGLLNIERIESNFNFLDSSNFLIILNATLELTNKFLQELEPHIALYGALDEIITIPLPVILSDILIKYLNFEFTLLRDLGFSLDFSRCAVSNCTDSLKYISPKTGAVVSEAVGKPYHNKLLEIPNFLTTNSCTPKDLLKAFELSSTLFNNFALSQLGVKKLYHRQEVAVLFKSIN